MSKRAADFFANLDFLREGLDIEDDVPGRQGAQFLDALAGRCTAEGLSPFFRQAVERVHQEIDDAFEGSRQEPFRTLENVLGRMAKDGVRDNGFRDERLTALWAALFPEALYLDENPDRQIEKLRKKRTVEIVSLCDDVIYDPAEEMIFTSNVLLSPPVSGMDLPEDEELRQVVEGAEKAAAEEQSYWYDHPVPIGVPAINDEAVYGLRGLSETLKYEKLRGNTSPSGRLTVLLSVSVTHQSLREWALPWLKAQLASAGAEQQDGLDVHAFTEADAETVIDIIASWLPADVNPDSVRAAFGVDGEYGRHYSFLKALPALWGVFSGGQRKATFKIDLDQVFPQDVLTAETGASVFEHFRTGLWGAQAIDDEGRKLELGMIAGGLVNEKDIGAGLFTPDIPWPSRPPVGEDALFYKQRPMAVSTRAELMTRYGYPGFPDGKTAALQRIHVTGGTNGIRFDSLRHYRPFTPSFIGRAEDQAYILSVLDGRGSEEAGLAYAHASGLLMRHDKEAFATDAVKAGKAGSYVGDLVRLFVFSGYADLLPGGSEGVKAVADPFTGCFITSLPATLASLRLALRLLSAEGGSEEERSELLALADIRLEEWISDPEGSLENLRTRLDDEKRAWKGFYDALDSLEADLIAGSAEAQEASSKFEALLEHCRVAG